MTWDVDYLRDNRDENMGFLSKTLLPDGTEIPGTNFDYNYLQHRKVDVVSSALDFILPLKVQDNGRCQGLLYQHSQRYQLRYIGPYAGAG